MYGPAGPFTRYDVLYLRESQNLKSNDPAYDNREYGGSCFLPPMWES